jgi:hypothetical protein
MLTLSKLAVRNEYCQEIYDKGGLKFIINCLAEQHLHNQVIIKVSLFLFSSLKQRFSSSLFSRVL